MTEYLSRVRDLVNQTLPTYATAAVNPRGFLHYLDPLLSGSIRFGQRSGAPPNVMSPQRRGKAANALTAGQDTIDLTDSRLERWLQPGQIISVELGELQQVRDFSVLANGTLRIFLVSPLVSAHAEGVVIQIEKFPVTIQNPTEGNGQLTSPYVPITSEFILVPGDIVEIDNAQFELTEAIEVSVNIDGTITYDCKTSKDGGFPASPTGDTVYIVARLAYESDTIVLPLQPNGRLPTLTGPFAFDWVSGPILDNLFPNPESKVYVQAVRLGSAGPLDAQHLIEKNDTETRVPIRRDQLLFWEVVEGGINWNGVNTVVQGFVDGSRLSDGRAHVHTRCEPNLDPAPPVVQTETVPAFIPHTVNVTPRSIQEEITVLRTDTGAVIPELTSLQAGTVDITNGSNAVVGTDTNFLSVFGVGDYIKVGDADAVEILSVNTDTSITLVSNYAQDTQTGAQYRRVNYIFDATGGVVTFADEYSLVQVVIQHRPSLEWTLVVESTIDDLEVNVKIGDEPLQTFNVPTANTPTTLTILSSTSDPITNIDLTARAASGVPTPFELQVGDWQQRGSGVTAIRYWLLTGAERDYGWASSGLLAKPMWHNLDDVRAFLDGSGSLARRFDNGFLSE